MIIFYFYGLWYHCLFLTITFSLFLCLTLVNLFLFYEHQLNCTSHRLLYFIFLCKALQKKCWLNLVCHVSYWSCTVKCTLLLYIMAQTVTDWMLLHAEVSCDRDKDGKRIVGPLNLSRQFAIKKYKRRGPAKGSMYPQPTPNLINGQRFI